MTKQIEQMSPQQIEISNDPERLDVELVYQFLSQSYWASNRSREVIERSLRHSLCFGAYCANKQIGFGRAITDRAVFAYIADVFVLPEWRGRGIGKLLICAMLEDSSLRELQTILLRTRDAHDLYRKFGFGPVNAAENMMARYSRGRS